VCSGPACTLFALATGCNAVLGINEPGDLDAGLGAGGGAMQVSDARPRSDGGDARADVAPIPYSWADWPMPNPPMTGLPNPQSYDTEQIPDIVVDNITKLKWQRKVEDVTFAWSDAVSYCENFMLDGEKWRLPTRIELLSIIDYTQPGPVIDPSVFPATPSERFWSASPFTDDSTNAWSVHFGFATTIANTSEKASAYRARCVANPSEAQAQRYTAQGGGVFDSLTKLTWQKELSDQSYTWKDASDFCTALDLDGTGWRLPSVSELQTLVDETRSDPAIALNAFPGTPSDYFWTSSVLPRFTSYAWTVYFGFGLSTFFDANQNRRVRCVR